MADKKCENKNIRDISSIMETFGKYQIIQYILIFLSSMWITMININYVFVAGDINYRCRVNECDGQNSNSSGLYPQWWPNSTIDRCSSPVLRQHADPVCGSDSFSDKQQICTQWVYENNNTVIAELDLACQPWLSNLIGTIHNIGMLCSILIAGWISDRFGRKPALVFCVVGGTVGYLKTFITSYYLYITIEFLEALVSGGTYAAAMVSLIETASIKRRLLSGVLFAYSIYAGECLYACIAMFFPYWKTIIRIINGPPIFFITYIFLIQESPKWQIVSGKLDNAKKAIKRIAEMNNITINYEELAAMTNIQLKQKFAITDNTITEGYVDIFKSKSILVRLMVAAVCLFTTSFVYFGLMMNSVWLPGDKYVNFLLSTVMSFPGELISLYLMNRFGRKVPLMISCVLSGTLSVVSAIIPNAYVWAKISLYLLSKVVIAACFTGSVTYTMELYPTSVRGRLLGLGAFAARLGGMLAPLTPILNTISTVLPCVCFGCSTMTACVLLCLTPETKDTPLFNTIKQVEESDRARKVGRAKKGEKSTDRSMETVISKL